MPKVIEVVYESGVFKPLEKVDLKEGTKVKIEIKRDISHLRGKYGKRKKVELLELRDEIHDRRNHIRR
ncbi:antitoxin family protein [Archaeoglobus sp.]